MPRNKTINWISCIFWFGTDAVGIRIIRRGGYFFERSKSSSDRYRDSSYAAPPAVEVKPTNLKELLYYYAYAH